ncbi:hypothetical protein LCGC14_1565670 [marine sediment metagenome]|uniref:Uncharacterized protein n=1 Tax=marine sediment metagenome TaxID=412755 RepID=A0A0F9J7C3_9ZZZZ|nr:hypothetical protein [Candidatus Anoxychlamydiales bacterium]HEU64320.1 hypothetical protein [Chlamydiota bacterium]
MKYKVTINNNLNLCNYFLTDANAVLTINGNLKCRKEIYIDANIVIINGDIDCAKINICAKSILVNGTIHSNDHLLLSSQDNLHLNSRVFCNNELFLIGNKIIFRSDISNRNFTDISAGKVFLLGSITSHNFLKFWINDYIIKIGECISFSEDKNYFTPEKELKDLEKIKRVLVEDFEIEEPELSQILDKCTS